MRGSTAVAEPLHPRGVVSITELDQHVQRGIAIDSPTIDSPKELQVILIETLKTPDEPQQVTERSMTSHPIDMLEQALQPVSDHRLLQGDGLEPEAFSNRPLHTAGDLAIQLRTGGSRLGQTSHAVKVAASVAPRHHERRDRPPSRAPIGEYLPIATTARTPSFQLIFLPSA